jgi:hypothetical protein
MCISQNVSRHYIYCAINFEFFVDFSKAQEQNSISFPIKFSTKKIVEKLMEKHLQELSTVLL